MSVIRKTRSVCPRCLRPVSAQLSEKDGAVFLEKDCPEHGRFSVIVWHGLADFDAWRAGAAPLGESEGLGCPHRCAGGICEEHQQGSCCVLLEVTRRCNLNCSFCFAHDAAEEPTMEQLKRAVDKICEHSRPLIQLSGGEPTLRDDLPELIRYIRDKGVRFVQLNTNGLRLAADAAYTKSLADAGLNIVFLQFDGVTDAVYETLRGKALLETKKRCIEACGERGLGVTLVPTLVRGVNEAQVGDIIRFGVSRSPVVRGVHFQPVSYFGHYPAVPQNDVRYTLDELIAALETQAGISREKLMPSRCDHPACGLHGSFVVLENGVLLGLTTRKNSACEQTDAQRNRDYIGSRWSGIGKVLEKTQSCCCCGGEAENKEEDGLESMDYFLQRVKNYSFTVTAMAFQDAMNFDVERLRRCSLHVYHDGVLKPFCARYLTAFEAD